MSKRYGRNQRRAHRERIAELEGQVYRLSSTGPGGWRYDPAWPDQFTLDERFVLSSEDCSRDGFDELARREATVRVMIYDGLEDALRYCRRINWRGLAWIAYDPGRFIQDRNGVTVELRLEAVAPRDWTAADLPPHRQ